MKPSAIIEQRTIDMVLKVAMTEPKKKKSRWAGKQLGKWIIPYWELSEARKRELKTLARYFKFYVMFYDGGEIGLSRYVGGGTRDTMHVFPNPKELAAWLLAQYSESHPEKSL